MKKRNLFLLSIIVLIGGGCVGIAPEIDEKSADYPVFDYEEDVVVSDEAEESEEIPEAEEVPIDPSTWVTYTNTAYGYSFDYEPDTSVFIEVDQSTETFIPADERAQSVKLAASGTEWLFFCCEPVYLQVDVFQEETSAHEWLSQHKYEYISENYFEYGDVAQVFKDIDGELALGLKTSGELGRTGNIYAVTRNGFLYIITYGMESDVFDAVIDSFTFIDIP